MNYTKKIATTFAYMIGASKETLIMSLETTMK